MEAQGFILAYECRSLHLQINATTHTKFLLNEKINLGERTLPRYTPRSFGVQRCQHIAFAAAMKQYACLMPWYSPFPSTLHPLAEIPILDSEPTLSRCPSSSPSSHPTHLYSIRPTMCGKPYNRRSAGSQPSPRNADPGPPRETNFSKLSHVFLSGFNCA